jgi:hypothetical protein
LGRIVDIVEGFFARCSTTACVPPEALPLVAYWRADSAAASAAVAAPPQHSAGTGGAAMQVSQNYTISEWPGTAASRGGRTGSGSVDHARQAESKARGETEPIREPSAESRAASQSAIDTQLHEAPANGPAVAGAPSDQWVEQEQRAQHVHHKNKWTWGKRDALPV